MEESNILELLTKDEDITWRSIIYDLVKSEKMNPWDIDVSLLTKKYIEIIKKLKEMNFRISGKVLLAAAILLRIKANILVGEDISELDRLFASAEEGGEMMAEDFYSELEQEFGKMPEEERPELFPRTPQPRNRKVSMYDLVFALQKALEVKQRRVLRRPVVDIAIPKKKVDISVLINNIYIKIKNFISRFNKRIITFSELVPSKEKKDKINTFIPLLHLATQQMVELTQKTHFGEIEIALYTAKTEKEVEKEIREANEPEEKIEKTAKGTKKEKKGRKQQKDAKAG